MATGYTKTAESDTEAEEKEKKPPPKYWQTSETTPVRWSVQIFGCCCCLVVILWVVSWLLTLIVVGDSDTLPRYAKSILWLSLGHNLNSYDTAPSPPPDFRMRM